MPSSRHTKLRNLISKTDKQLKGLPGIKGVQVWHADCLRVLREEYGDTSPEVNDWRSIPME